MPRILIPLRPILGVLQTSSQSMPYMAHQDEYGKMISVDGATIADSAGEIGAVGISRVEVVGDDDHDATLLLRLVSIAS
ncbi:hypothetical protein Tco_0685763 [Tanacetum coccineum]